jgi:cobaltochelatase CobN
VAELDEPADQNFVRAHALADAEEHGDWRRATTRIFGSKPGAYGAGLLPLIDARNWRDDRDLAEVYAVWGGYAYGRGLDGRAARNDLETVYRRMAVAAKNVDTREHDIADSDDYFQYHGGMVAMVRALRGNDPAAYIGDSHRPEQVKTRTLAEETKRVFRARVVNPRWIEAMRRHGYKGAFELAATVDYLFGYDATAGVVDDWMYEQLAASYIGDPAVRDFLEKSNPWALRGITERLLEAADRGLWAQPEQATLDQLRAAYLAVEGDLEGS